MYYDKEEKSTDQSLTAIKIRHKYLDKQILREVCGQN